MEAFIMDNFWLLILAFFVVSLLGAFVASWRTEETPIEKIIGQHGKH